ncbi:alpha-N-acetylgalactosaminide alpha-2,6-sialyltransferase 2 [Nematolebias whitei]|uniref:alpha-N-acetylgalactosaminide alpha-2,6-sialyltransferase 2 n=1 Tax=Nematolebias whitei TaxID=451745 RepID=UPI0018984AD9|nr:alpha-N-acetylgalactosaminide alpha-2,6-sialyltransferase 2 [Nematolebias whitei]
MGMVRQRGLLVCVGAVTCLLGIYILCLSTQWPPFLTPPKSLHSPAANFTSSKESPNRPKVPKQNPDPPQNIPASKTKTDPKLPKPAPNQVLDLSKSSSRSESDKTRIKPPKAAGPPESPFIGDSYMEDDVPRKTNCLSNIQSRIKTSGFGGQFLEWIPVLQGAKHVSPEEYERLRQYPGTHGWRNLDYKTLAGTLSVLNGSANLQMLDDWESRRNGTECSRCAVVGNGGILKGSRRGREIDGHHYVFRTNGAVIKGFEEDVGTRTTHYIFSTNTMMNSMRSYAGAGYRGPPVSPETRYVFLPDHDRDYLLMKAAATHTQVERGPERNKDPTKYFGQKVSAEKLKMFHPDFIRYLRNRFLRSNALNTKYKDLYRPSTGASMLLAALHTCDQVSAYGFMTPDFQRYSDHYFDSTYHQVGFFINHDLRMELTLWQQLHKAGLLQLYMRR